jgi:ribulose-phosphate 3-epimerase
MQVSKSHFIAPSILSADFARLGAEVDRVTEAGADLLHFDVMDNHYVPNLSFGPMICQALTNYGVSIPIDVHLMVQPVDDLISRFIDAGADYITFHPEASNHIDRSLELIKAGGCKAGLVLNPATPLSLIEPVFEKLDMLLLMSVNPGFGGQKFIPYVLDKIRVARQMIDERNLAMRLEVDGGIKLDNIREVARAGADTFVMGSAIFDSENYCDTLAAIRKELQRTD